MARFVIADASPLIGLSIVGGLPWLKTLFEQVWLPEQVANEIPRLAMSGLDPLGFYESISPEHWVYLCTHFESRFKGLVGSATR